MATFTLPTGDKARTESRRAFILFGRQVTDQDNVRVYIVRRSDDAHKLTAEVRRIRGWSYLAGRRYFVASQADGTVWEV